MKLDQLDVFHVSYPLKNPWRTAYGKDTSIHSVLVRSVSGDYYSWSESTPFFAPHYMSESAGSVFYHITEIFGPNLVGGEFDTALKLNEKLNIYRGNSFAKAAIEMGWWTLQSRLTGNPLHELLGGEKKSVLAGADFGIQDSIEILLEKIQEVVDVGCPRIKLKVSPSWDLDVLRIVTKTFPKSVFHIDCNAAYSLSDIDFFRAIDNIGLAFIEQPLHYRDIIDHAELSKKIQTPICLDERVVDPFSAEQAIRIGACQYINIKPGRVGGFYNSIKIHDMAYNAGIPVWVGGMLESSIGRALCIELATLKNCVYPNDISPPTYTHKTDLGVPAVSYSKPFTFSAFANSLPEPNEEILLAYSLRKKSIIA